MAVRLDCGGGERDVGVTYGRAPTTIIPETASLPFPIFTRRRMSRVPSQPRRFVQDLYLKELGPHPALSPDPRHFDPKIQPLLYHQLRQSVV